MAQKQKIGVKGKIIHSQAREIISNVLEFMKDEAENGVTIPITRFKERLLAATKISDKTYRQVTREAVEVKSGEKSTFSTPSKKRRITKTKTDLSEGDIKAIRSIIHDFYLIEKRQPTLKGIRQKIIDSGIDFHGSLPSLGTLIKNMGFRWKKTADNRSVLIESYDIRLKRVKYLRQLQLYFKEDRPIIFTDESYIHSSHSQSNCWTDESSHSFRKPISKGSRLIMVHAGGKDGFINNDLLMFRSGSKSGDYHDDMNNSNFIKWTRERLLPNFPPRGVLVIDNASYHNVIINKDPTSATLKKDMIAWLVQRNISHDSQLTKPELYEIIKKHKNQHPQYVLDTEMAKYDFRVLRLPPYHPELNPIEKIWAQVKQYVASRIRTFKLDDVMKLAQEKFEAITSENWASICSHTDKIVERYIEKEHLLDNTYDEFNFMVNTGDSDDDEDFWLSDDEKDEEPSEASESFYAAIPGISPL